MTDWPVKTLGDVCEVIAGQSPEGKFYNKEGKGVPFYQGKKDFSERVLGSPTTWTTEVTKMSRPGDILMSVRAPVGPVNLCPIEACIGRGLAAIRPSSKTDTDFIFYYLESIQSEIAGTEGAVFASINKAQIADLRCPVPPLGEQKRIVELLDAATARVTELTACYEQARTHANNLFTSALRDALESNPDWPVKTLGEVAKWGSGGTPQSGVAKYYGGDIPWCVIGDLTEGDVWETERSITEEGLLNSSAKIVEVGAVLIAMYGASIGRTGVVRSRMATNQAIAFAYANETIVYSDYLLMLLQSQKQRFVNAGQGAAQPNISQLVLKEWSVLVPPLEEQKRIVARLDLMRAKTSEMVAAYDAKLQAAKNLRQSILEAAFAGDL